MTRCSTHSLLYETLRWPLSSLLLLFLYDERARVPHFYYREWWWCTGAAVLSPERALFIFSTVRLLAERAHIYQALQRHTRTGTAAAALPATTNRSTLSPQVFFGRSNQHSTTLHFQLNASSSTTFLLLPPLQHLQTINNPHTDTLHNGPKLPGHDPGQKVSGGGVVLCWRKSCETSSSQYKLLK